MSLPLEPTTYDLIAESDDGLKRVQVIVTAAGGHYVIPVDVVGGRMNLVLDEKYGQFAVPE